MSEDIVTRLRDWASKICSLKGDQNLDNKAVLARAAADEIERLRAERDEARRQIAMLLAPTTEQGLAQYAASRGWDCFAEDRNEQPRHEPQGDE